MSKKDEYFVGIELSYGELPQETKYRFAEIEIGQAIYCLTPFTVKPNAKVHTLEEIFKLIQSTYTEDDLEKWIETFMSVYTMHATKEEKGIYFRYRNISYKNIREVTGLSPNTIAKTRFSSVYHFPKYPKWDDYMLRKWDELKKNLNLWGQNLYHMQES
jgi:hemerythrin superfamily protein